ncbi:MAG: DUF1800 family protein [Lentimonas sp.]
MKHLSASIRLAFQLLLLGSLPAALYAQQTTLVFTPVEDLYIEGTTRQENTALRIEQGSRVRTVYMKFSVSGIPSGGVIVGSTLKMTESIDPGSGTLRFYRGSSSNWTESSISAGNAPETRAQVGVRSGSIGDGATISVDVDSLVTGNGTYTVIVKMDSGGNDVAFGSSESGSPPLLEVRYQGEGEPPTTGGNLLPANYTMDPAGYDGDDNGLPDVWEAIYRAWDIDPESDSDGDGVNNKIEASFGTDPYDPENSPEFEIRPGPWNTVTLSWNRLDQRPGMPMAFANLGSDTPAALSGTPTANGDRWELNVPISGNSGFFQLANAANDRDSDQVPDWLEPMLGFGSGVGDSNSVSKPKAYDTDGDENPDVTLDGDLAAFNEIYLRTSDEQRMTQAQAARLLLQGTFGPADRDEVDYVARIGAEAWIDEQISLPASYTRPYIDTIKADFKAGRRYGYQVNSGGGNAFVGGSNYTTAWMRVALQSEDQLRQRVAFALSQILVAARTGTLANQPRSIAAYYDLMIEHAFGNYEDLLLQVSLSPIMGEYLSHLGNRKADPAALRFPDENYAREIMQLFSIGLWELNKDGSRKLDDQGEPIPTYGNSDITELARVFTGVGYASRTNSNTSFGSGWRDDGDSQHQYMITPMKLYASEHDFGSKKIVTGNGNYHTIPARGWSNANAMRDVEDVVYHLTRHPNTAPFICRQLIQFLITSNPSPEYVERVADVFVNNGNGTTGDLEAVVRAIYLDREARDPFEHLATPHFGQLREPLVRHMHLARILKLDRHQGLMTWDWGNHERETLQEPMRSPSVFNFYRPDYQLFGTLADNDLDSPAFGIVNSYSSISFPNWIWRMCEQGFNLNGYNFSEDLSELRALANDIPALLDHLSLLYCAGTLSTDSREAITTALAAESNLTDRARLAAYLVLVSPEGSCLK